MADEYDVSRIVMTFPAATKSDSGFGVRDKDKDIGFAWFYKEKVSGQKERVERRDVLAIRVAHAHEKEILIASDPAKFFDTDHYRGYPAILVNLPAIEEEELTELLTEAWRLRAPRKLVAEFDKEQEESHRAINDPSAAEVL